MRGNGSIFVTLGLCLGLLLCSPVDRAIGAEKITGVQGFVLGAGEQDCDAQAKKLGLVFLLKGNIDTITEVHRYQGEFFGVAQGVCDLIYRNGALSSMNISIEPAGDADKERIQVAFAALGAEGLKKYGPAGGDRTGESDGSSTLHWEQGDDRVMYSFKPGAYLSLHSMRL